MINFFRRIRKQLADDNKPLKYMRYAIGEIVLVMIGILLALQVNNWNEVRKSKIKAEIFKEKIISDLINDTLNIETQIGLAKNYKKNIQGYYKFFESGNKPIGILIDSALKVPTPLYRYHPINFTFLGMQSSGNLELLTERESHSLMELSNTQKQAQIIFEKKVSEYFDNKIERGKYLENDLSDSDFYDIIGVEPDDKDLINGLKYQHHMLMVNDEIHGTMIEQGEIIKEESKRIIALLKAKQN
ncbi:DUF6090 family protein [uncultured Eudoraea sp.]|uniref:DUF6090 family protein n=1 Tax=uncultured Eudoraea sp. TaxID=1035614 RepID=UPI00261C1F06|nr:DUF6090 family protein [uncultured Eudoraea sp.]